MLQQEKLEKILFAKRSCSGAAGSSEALLIIFPDSRLWRASFFASLRALCESLFQILSILLIHVRFSSPPKF